MPAEKSKQKEERQLQLPLEVEVEERIAKIGTEIGIDIIDIVSPGESPEIGIGDARERVCYISRRH